MVDRTSQDAVIMTIEIGRVAGDALRSPGNENCRGNQAAVCRVVAGYATLWRMDLTGPSEG